MRESPLGRTTMAGRLLGVAALSLLGATGACGRHATAPTPASLSTEEWQKRLFENPSDSSLWSQELDRVNAMRTKINALQAPAEDSTVAGALANNDQLRGIALRHLKRYHEALAALAASDQSLSSLWAVHRCNAEHATDECQLIAQLRAMTFTYMANVHEDMGNHAEMSSALKNAVAASRSTDRYQEFLVTSMARLVHLDDFTDATSLLLDEINNVSGVRNDRLVKVVEEAGTSYSLALFQGISWKPDGGIRDADPRDFVDNTGIGLGRQFKYGMTDWAEDHATFATAMVTEELYAKAATNDLVSEAKRAGYGSADELRTNLRVPDFVRRELLDSNFEPVAKFLVIEQLNFTFQLRPKEGQACPKHSSQFPFTEIRRRLREAPAGTVATTTQDILFSVERLVESLQTNCRTRV